MRSSYLLVDPAGVHPSGVGLDDGDGPPHPLIGPPLPHHAVLLLTDEGGPALTQELGVPAGERSVEP